MMTLLAKLAKLHKETETNFELSCFWDAGFTAKIGDKANGYKAEESFDRLDSAVLWLIEELEKRT